MDTKQKIKQKLGNRYRRLTSGKLYFIKDKSGKKISFIPNDAQKKFLKSLRYRNVVLKARQLGFSTLIDLILLDACLFQKNKSAGIIAQDLDNAEKIFEDKIKFVFENLPSRLKSCYKLKTDKTREIAFLNNGSRISVGNSFRGGTYQYMHISEFGKICAKFPNKAREIMIGALNTVGKNQYIFIESTAEGNGGYFFDICHKAQNNSENLTELDFKFHFYPRYECKDYVLEQKSTCPKSLNIYFQLLESKGIFLSQSQKNRYIKQWEVLGDDIKREFPSFPGEAFDMTIKGSYYEQQLNKAQTDGRMTTVSWDPKLKVNTSWDLGGAGGGDETCIWFFQIFGGEIRLIDYREGNGLSMIDIIRQQILSKPYNYGYHLAPHDIRVHEYSTGRTRYDTAAEFGVRFDIVSNISISDGIDKTRNIIDKCRFDKINCKKGISALSNYQREWDASLGAFKDKPLHNRASNGADAFRMLAVGLKNTSNIKNYYSQKVDYDEFL